MNQYAQHNYFPFSSRLAFVLAAGLVFFVSVVSPKEPATSELEPLPIETAIGALQLRTDCPIDLSPDGAFVAYTVRSERRRTTETEARFRTFSSSGVSSFIGKGNDVLVSDTRTGETQNLTNGLGTSWTPSWSPDGKRLAFYSDRDGAARVWLWDSRSRKLQRLSAAIARPLFSTERILWAPDGQSVFVKLLPENTTIEKAAELLTASAVRERGNTSPGATVYIYRSQAGDQAKDIEPAASDALHLFNRGLADFARIDVRSGWTERLIRNAHIRGVRLSPTGESIALTSVRKLELSPSANLHDLNVISLKSRRISLLRENIEGMWTGEFFSWSPNDKFIAFSTLGPGRASRVVLVDATGKSKSRSFDLPPATRPSSQSPTWDAPSENLFLIYNNAIWKVAPNENKAVEFAAIANRRLSEIVAPHESNIFWRGFQGGALFVKTFDPATLKRGFYRIDPSGRVAAAEIERDENYGSAVTTDLSADHRKIATLVESAAKPPEVWFGENGLAGLRRITHTEKDLDNFPAGESRLIDYQTAKGQKLRAAMLLPVGYDKAKRYPLITVVYGGANLATRANDYGMLGHGVNNLQLLASRGYAVLLPDLTTRGANVSADVAEMALPAVDEAVRLRIADGDRVGVMGHSFGGYTTLALVTHTDRFKAAMMTAGFGNLFGLYGSMRDDGEAFNVQWWESGPHGFGGTPWDKRDKYLENSPIFDLNRVRTPMLIVHGSKDVSVQPFLSDEIFVGLRRLGRKVVYAKYENEGHAPAQWGYSNQIDYAGRMIEWFDDHLK